MLTHGWLSLIPPLAAILLAIATRRVVLSLFVGVFAGVLIAQPVLTSAEPEAIYSAGRTAVWQLLEDHLWWSLSEAKHLRVFAFTLLMGAMIGVIHRSGGMRALVSGLSFLVKGRRGGQLATWALGLIVFVDDYANSLLLGNTLRPLTDRLRISREKLAYLVDSTAAPVSGLALVSTWVAGEIGYIEGGFESLGLSESADGFVIFVQTIPYRFYVLWALLFVPMVALMGRDFGPMHRAETRALRFGSAPETDGTEPAVTVPSGQLVWLIAVVPIVICVGMTFWLLGLTGWAEIGKKLSADGEHFDPRQLQMWIRLIGNGDSYVALLYGSLAGVVSAMVLAWAIARQSAERLLSYAREGAALVMPALAILWLAWVLSRLTGEDYLGTDTYLSGLLERGFPTFLLPTAVFSLASIVAFSTGTSWGTMSIMMPIVIRVAYRVLMSAGGVDALVAVDDPLLLACIAGVLAGAIFGDHCSPISDTTVLSSQASGCDHVAHVRTQLPYAVVVAAVSIVFGTLPVGLGVHPLWLLPGGVVALAVILWVFGKPVVEPPEIGQESLVKSE